MELQQTKQTFAELHRHSLKKVPNQRTKNVPVKQKRSDPSLNITHTVLQHN
jgi:hypothetical protein